MRLRRILVLSLQWLIAPGLAAAPFDFQQVRDEARQLASRPFQPLSNSLPAELRSLSYTEYQNIQFRHDKALWADENLPFRIEFFLPGAGHRDTVALHEVTEHGARPIPFAADGFLAKTNRLSLPDNLGYAGFRVVSAGQSAQEVAVFLGASYLRMVGFKQVFGASARGLALNTVHLGQEEFPTFRQFWLRKPLPTDRALTLWALLDSPSVAGAFEYEITPGTTTVAKTRVVYFPRQLVRKFGVAPVTSMFWYDGNNHPPYSDYRPEVHDSDGLLMASGKGQTLWRPLDAAKMMRVNVYADLNPRGYGLVQRDRNFENYQDLVARFENRPNVWVEPVGQWGSGAVELIQLPTDIEYTDNAIAFWVPSNPPKAGEALELAYNLHWTTNELSPPSLGRVRATRIGLVKAGEFDARHNIRFVIDFGGPMMEKLSAREQLDAEVNYGSGTRLVADTVARNDLNGTWRLVVEILAPDKAVDIQALLKRGGEPVTETWTYTWQP